MKAPNLVNAAKAVGRVAEALVNGDAVTVSSFKRRARLQVCATCPALNKEGQCDDCTCFVSLKSRLATETCPRGKWPA